MLNVAHTPDINSTELTRQNWLNEELFISGPAAIALPRVSPSQNDPVRTLQLDPLGTTGVNVAAAEMAQTEQWIQATIDDQLLKTAIMKRSADHDLSRIDMLAIFKQANDNNRVDRREFYDLKSLVNGQTQLLMADSVQNLSDKVINGDRANQTYRGKPLGNLTIGSSASDLNKLVGKWFLGIDRPEADGPYRPIDRPLFANGISYQDVQQGDVGNCYFLASLAATALQAPQQIQDMFIDNGDGTYTVRFFNRGKADYVTVDNQLPTLRNGKPLYADQRRETWVALAEKAYAQINASGWLKQNGENSYEGIANGWPQISTAQITGRPAKAFSFSRRSVLLEAFRAGKQVTLGSKNFEDEDRKIVGNHAYTLVGYNPKTELFTLYNPWGEDGYHSAREQDANPKDGKLQLSWPEIRTYFAEWFALK